jgi:hypothetical protein
MTAFKRSSLAGFLLASGALTVLACADELNPQPLPPSPGFALAMPAGPDTRQDNRGIRQARRARAYFWAWAVVNI